MSKETEADRIIRERKLQKEMQAKRDRIESAHQKEITREKWIREVNEGIPRALQLLTALGYPDMEELEVVVEEPRLGGRLGYRERHYTKAAWTITQFQAPSHGDTSLTTYTVKIHLLSDGMISIGTHDGALAIPLQALKDPARENILFETYLGLRGFLQNLEAKLSK